MHCFSGFFGMGFFFSFLFVNLVIFFHFSHLDYDLIAHHPGDLSFFRFVENQLKEVARCLIREIMFLGVLPVERRREEQVNTQLKGVVDHTGNDSFKSA